MTIQDFAPKQWKFCTQNSISMYLHYGLKFSKFSWLTLLNLGYMACLSKFECYYIPFNEERAAIALPLCFQWRIPDSPSPELLFCDWGRIYQDPPVQLLGNSSSFGEIQNYSIFEIRHVFPNLSAIFSILTKRESSNRPTPLFPVENSGLPLTRVDFL